MHERLLRDREATAVECTLSRGFLGQRPSLGPPSTTSKRVLRWSGQAGFVPPHPGPDRLLGERYML